MKGLSKSFEERIEIEIKTCQKTRGCVIFSSRKLRPHYNHKLGFKDMGQSQDKLQDTNMDKDKTNVTLGQKDEFFAIVCTPLTQTIQSIL